MESRSNAGRGSGGRPGGRSSSGYGYSNGYGSSGYGYGYGGYGYGAYGGASAGTIVERTLQDYLLVVRERFWYIVLAFVTVMGAVAIYTFTRLPEYQSIASVEIFRRAPTVMEVQPVMDNPVSSTEDLNTQVNVL